MKCACVGCPNLATVLVNLTFCLFTMCDTCTEKAKESFKNKTLVIATSPLENKDVQD
jgi:hypothetical protein